MDLKQLEVYHDTQSVRNSGLLRETTKNKTETNMIEFELINRGWAWKLERFLNDAYAWHVDHGKVWKVLHKEGKPSTDEVPGSAPARWIGVLAVTELCGLGVICHFNGDPDVDPRVGLSAMKAGIKLLRQRYPAVYASVPAENVRLSMLVQRLGFACLWETGRRISGNLWYLYLLRQSETEKSEK